MNTDEQESIFKASKYCPVSFFFFCLQIYIPRRSLTFSLSLFFSENNINQLNSGNGSISYLLFIRSLILRCSLKFPFLSNDHFKCPLLVYSFLIYQFFFFFMRSFVCLLLFEKFVHLDFLSVIGEVSNDLSLSEKKKKNHMKSIHQ